MESNRIPDWELCLDRYIRYKESLSNGIYNVSEVVIARKPWNFSEELSKITFGASVFFQTDYRYGEELPDQDTLELIPGNPPSGGLIPLPFPPEQAWCVYLGDDSDSSSNKRVMIDPILLVIGLHKDLYHADIVIHEVESNSTFQSIEGMIKILGCDLP